MYNLRKIGKKLDYIDSRLQAGTRRNKEFYGRDLIYREMTDLELLRLEEEKERLLKMLPKNLYPYSRTPAVAVYLEDEVGYLPITEVGSPHRLQQMKENG